MDVNDIPTNQASIFILVEHSLDYAESKYNTTYLLVSYDEEASTVLLCKKDNSEETLRIHRYYDESVGDYVCEEIED